MPLIWMFFGAIIHAAALALSEWLIARRDRIRLDPRDLCRICGCQS